MPISYDIDVTKGQVSLVWVGQVPITDWAVLMDRLTATQIPAVAGLINVNTAPPIVLSTIPGLTQNQVDQIVSKRQAHNIRKILQW